MDIKEHIKPLLTAIGDKSTCKGCGAEIYWIVHKNKKKVPYTVEGRNHFIDCPARDRFRK